MLELSPDMLSSPGLTHPVAWRDVEAWGVVTGRRTGLNLVIAEGQPLPQTTGFRRFTRVVQKKRQVTIGGYGVKGMGVRDFAATIRRYIDADHARRVLDEQRAPSSVTSDGSPAETAANPDP